MIALCCFGRCNSAKYDLRIVLSEPCRALDKSPDTLLFAVEQWMISWQAQISNTGVDNVSFYLHYPWE